MADEVSGEAPSQHDDGRVPLEGTRREVLKTALAALGVNALVPEDAVASPRTSAPTASPTPVRAQPRSPTPDTSGPVKDLYSMETVRRVAAVADTFFPPNTVQGSQGQTRTLRASDARPERYLQHRAAWEPTFGVAVLGALRALSEASERHHGQSFESLSPDERTTLLEDFQKEARSSFEVLHTAIATGLFADPEYGGNNEWVGWYYSRFLEIG